MSYFQRHLAIVRTNHNEFEICRKETFFPHVWQRKATKEGRKKINANNNKMMKELNIKWPLSKLKCLQRWQWHKYIHDRTRQ